MTKKIRNKNDLSGDVSGLLREIDEEVRVEHLKNLAQNYKWYIVSFLAVLFLSIFGYWTYHSHNKEQQQQKGGKLAQIVAFQDNQLDEKRNALLALIEDTSKDDIYNVLARFMLADIYTKQNDIAQSLEIVEGLNIEDQSASSSSTTHLKTLAHIKIYYTLIHKLSYEEMFTKLGKFAEKKTDGLRFMAAEILAWSAYYHKNYEKALYWTDIISTEKVMIPRNMGVRAEVLKTVLKAYVSNTQTSVSNTQTSKENPK